MGGAKKKPVSSTQSDSGGAHGDNNSAASKPTKKGDSKKGSGQPQQQKQKLPVLVEEAGGRKALDNMKAITVHSFARTVGVKISVANAYIRSLEAKNILICVGGYSGHRVYQLKK